MHGSRRRDAPRRDVFYGRAERIASGTSWLSADARLFSPRQRLELVTPGDINADGLADLILGSDHYDVNGLYVQPSSLLLPEGYYWLPGQAQRLSGDVELADAATATLPRVEAAGDLDGDGVRDVFVFDGDETRHLFYGAAGLFDAGAEFSAAAATFQPYTGEPRTNLLRARDLDGDGDDELVSAFALGENAGWSGPFSVAVMSGTASRMSGAIQLAEPTSPFPEYPAQRSFVEAVFSAGDLDGDGAGDVITRSGYYIDGPTDPLENGVRPSVTEDGVSYERYSFSGTQLNIHYGTPGELATPLR